jgi:hypothetical protein
MQQFLANDGMIVVTHPSHSPDPTPYVIFFSQYGSWYHMSFSFPSMEVGTQGREILIHQHDKRNAGYICTVQNREYY